MFGVNLPFEWIDIGSVPDYWEATRLALTGQIRGYRLPGREISPGVRVGLNIGWNPDRVTIRGPVFIGGSTSIGDGAVIEGPTVIGSGCIIEPGAVIRGCILTNYTRVSSIARLEQVLMFGPNCIDPLGQYLDIAEAGLEWVVDDARKAQKFSPEQQELRELAALANQV
jgi:mannose-1-phosphate guanylyltransferase